VHETIIYGALLHDIGKLIKRGLQGKASYHYKHQELGEKWAREVGLSEDIVTIIKRHHQLRKNEDKYYELSVNTYSGGDIALHNSLKVVDIADNLSAGMERKDFNTNTGSFKRDAGLKSIFSNIHLNNSYKANHHNIWEPKNLKEYPYPIKSEEFNPNKQVAFYTKLWDDFRDEFMIVKNNLNEDTLLLLLQKYTFMIPEHTLVTDSGPPDTSLYHHLKSTAAVSLCIYKHLTEEKGLEWGKTDLSKDIYNINDNKFLLIAGDFSGIQKFIYTITSKAALKTVRARSFYLELLAECIVSHLVQELELCRSCIIYNSGGGFYLLAPNTNKVKDKIHFFKEKINQYLFDKFGFLLYVTLAARPLCGNNLKGKVKDKDLPLGKIWSLLKQDLGKQKGRKWIEIFTNDFEKVFEPFEEKGNCAACHQPIDKFGSIKLEDESLNLCSFCRNMVELGKRLPDLEVFYEIKEVKKCGFYLNIFGHIYCLDKHMEKNNVITKYHLTNLWDLTDNSYSLRNFPTGSYSSLKDFIELGQNATGLKKIGILRMDVDYLGRIFSRGLGETNTFARLNDLSERLNLYFKYYLPKLLADNTEDSITKVPRKKLLVNLVYSGGDDLFLVGTWDSTIDAAWAIYSDFRRFTGYNSDVTFSGGLTIADEKVAFYRLADEAGSEEKKAKSNGRDSFSIFGIPLKWSEVKNCLQQEKETVTLNYLLDILTKGLEYKEEKCTCRAYSRSFIQNLSDLIYYYFYSKSSNEIDNEKYWVFPQIHYYMTRAMQTNSGKKYKNIIYRPLFSVMLQEKVLEKRMLIALKIIDYLTRGGYDK